MDTSFMMGGALGLAVLASVAASRTEKLEASGDGPLAALTGNYHAAFLIGALFAAGAAFVGGVFLRPKSMPMHEGEETVGVPAVAEADGEPAAMSFPPSRGLQGEPMVVSYAQRSTLTALDELVCAVRAVVDRHADWRRTARLVARTLERHLPSPEILTDEQRAGDPDGYRSYPLHIEPDGSFSVVALVWRPGR